jgi:hypothetical protein
MRTELSVHHDALNLNTEKAIRSRVLLVWRITEVAL